MPTNYLGYQVTGNLLLEQINVEYYDGLHISEFFYVDMLNLNFTAVEFVSPNARIFDLYSSQIIN